MANARHSHDADSLYARLDEVRMSAAERAGAKAQLRAAEIAVDGVADTYEAVCATLAAGWHAGSRGWARRLRSH
jgi:hypothetical protein